MMRSSSLSTSSLERTSTVTLSLPDSSISCSECTKTTTNSSSSSSSAGLISNCCCSSCDSQNLVDGVDVNKHNNNILPVNSRLRNNNIKGREDEEEEDVVFLPSSPHRLSTTSDGNSKNKNNNNNPIKTTKTTPPPPQQQQQLPLHIVNPCFHSPLFQRAQIGEENEKEEEEENICNSKNVGLRQNFQKIRLQSSFPLQNVFNDDDNDEQQKREEQNLLQRNTDFVPKTRRAASVQVPRRQFFDGSDDSIENSFIHHHSSAATSSPLQPPPPPPPPYSPTFPPPKYNSPNFPPPTLLNGSSSSSSSYFYKTFPCSPPLDEEKLEKDSSHFPPSFPLPLNSPGLSSASSSASSSMLLSIDSLSAAVMDCLDEKLIQRHISQLLNHHNNNNNCNTKTTSSFPSSPVKGSGGDTRFPKRMMMSALSRFRTLHTKAAQIHQPKCINDNEIDNSNNNRNGLFGTPLGVIQSSTEDGSPLPRFVHDLMEYIVGRAQLAEWIFRKNGFKARIQDIKDCCSSLTSSQPIPEHLLDDTQLFDLGDTLKLYFRSLPECLFTDRVSALLQQWLRELPPSKHIQAAQYAMLLLPAENREALLILLRFLCGVARHSETNRMNAQNLATCWMPSLFQFLQQQQQIKKKEQPERQRSIVAAAAPFLPLENGGGQTRRRLLRRKTIEIGSIPSIEIIKNNNINKNTNAFNNNNTEKCSYEAMKQLLGAMIDGWERLTVLPDALCSELSSKRLLLGTDCCCCCSHELSVPVNNGQFEFSEDLHQMLRRQLFRLKEDHLFGRNNWHLQRVFWDGAQIYSCPVNDMLPELKTIRVQIVAPASPNLVLNALLHGRVFWDSNVIGVVRVGPSGQNFDLVSVQYRPALITHGKQAYLARRWTYGELDNDSTCSLIECSIGPRQKITNDEERRRAAGRVDVYESKFLIVPRCSDYSQITYISRVDFKGRQSQWYERVYAEMLVQQMRRLAQNLFQCKMAPLLSA